MEELESRWLPSVTLGSAAGFGVLGLVNTQVLNSNVTVTGAEGVSQGGKLTNMAPSTITGNAYEYAAGQYTGPGHLLGSLICSATQMAQADLDALTAATQTAALAPTQIFGSITQNTIVNGNGGVNVIQVNGDINLNNASLTLNGTSSDFFIINVTGSGSFGGSGGLLLAGGVTADHVLYNFTGASGSVTSHVGNVFYGTLLAPTYNFNLDGAFYGEIIGGGQSISLLSGAQVTQEAFAGIPSPPASPPPVIMV